MYQFDYAPGRETRQTVTLPVPMLFYGKQFRIVKVKVIVGIRLMERLGSVLK